MAAFLTLLYGLTAAPASQPRNAIMAQAVSVALALGFNYTDMPSWIKQSLATSLAIGTMCKFGIIHPPAAASCLAFSHSRLSWGNYGSILIATAILIFVSTLFNNLNLKRQYPTFWGVGFIIDALKKPKEKKI